MSRSGYTDDDDDPLAYGRWRAQVNSAIRGKRGQKFFADLVAALDAMPEKKLVAGVFQNEEGAVCAFGSLGKARRIDLNNIDTCDWEKLGSVFNIAQQLAQETMYVNDDENEYSTPEQRWTAVRRWAARQLKSYVPPPDPRLTRNDDEVTPT